MTASTLEARIEHAFCRIAALENVLYDLSRQSESNEPLFPMDVKKAVIDAGIMDQDGGR